MAEGDTFQSLMQFTEPDYNPHHGPRWHTALKSIMQQHKNKFSKF